MVTTISFKSPIPLDRQEFENIDDLLQYVFHLRNDEVDVDFGEMETKDISSSLQKKVDLSKQMNVESFSSLSS